MWKAFLALILGVAIGFGVPIVRKHWGFTAPGQGDRPRPNIRRTKLQHLAVPVGVSVIACVGLWILFSFLFSTPPPKDQPVKNAVSQPVPSAPGEGSVTGGPASAPPASGAAPAERESLVANTPIVKAALRVAPVVSSLDSVGGRLRERYPAPAGSPPSGTAPAAGPASPAPDAKTAKAEPPADSAKPPAKPETPAETAKTPPKPDAAASGSGNYTVHLASFGDKENAEKSLAQLKTANVPAFLSKVTIGDKVWYRLMAGRFANKEKAEKYGRDLQTRGLTKGMGDYQVKNLEGQD